MKKTNVALYFDSLLNKPETSIVKWVIGKDGVKFTPIPEDHVPVFSFMGMFKTIVKFSRRG